MNEEVLRLNLNLGAQRPCRHQPHSGELLPWVPRASVQDPGHPAVSLPSDENAPSRLLLSGGAWRVSVAGAASGCGTDEGRLSRRLLVGVGPQDRRLPSDRTVASEWMPLGARAPCRPPRVPCPEVAMLRTVAQRQPSHLGRTEVLSNPL